MSVEEYQSSTITDFRGPWTRVEASDVPSEGALLAENVEWDPGQVRSRYGFTSLFAAGEPMGAMCDWIKGYDGATPTGRAMTFINPTTNKARIAPNLSSYSALDLFTLSNMVTADFAFGGTRQYIAPLKADGTSAGQCRVVQIYGSAVQVDKAFMGGLSASLTVAETTTAGYTTAGAKRFAYRIESRTGMVGPLCPIVGGVFTPVEVTLTGSKTVNLSVNTTWPTEAFKVYFCVAVSANLNDWFQIPGDGVAVPGGSAYTANFIFNISDDDASANGILRVTDEQTILTQDTSGAGPFDPFNVIEIGDRMGYMATVNGIDTLFVSVANKHQVIPPDLNTITLPGFRRMTTGAMLLNSLWIIGPKWTYATSDTAVNPVEWQPPRLVDGAIGTPSPLGVSANPSQGYMWVASTGGLYLFNGAYPDKPASYYVSDWWNRIDWSSPALVAVKDFPHLQKVCVKAPLKVALDGSSPAGTYLLMFDYTRGTDYDKIAFAPWYFTNFTPGAVEYGLNPTTNLQEIWVAAANSTNANVYRQKNTATDASPFPDDMGYAPSRYQTALSPEIRKRGVGRLWQHHGAHLRISGSGGVNLTLYGLDGLKSAILRPIALDQLPGQEYLRRGHVLSEASSLLVETNAAGSYFILSAVQNYFSPAGTRI